MGMTDKQFKAMLYDELEIWEETLKLAQEEKAEKVILKAEQQIAKINQKLKA